MLCVPLFDDDIVALVAVLVETFSLEAAIALSSTGRAARHVQIHIRIPLLADVTRVNCAERSEYGWRDVESTVPEFVKRSNVTNFFYRFDTAGVCRFSSIHLRTSLRTLRQTTFNFSARCIFEVSLTLPIAFLRHVAVLVSHLIREQRLRGRLLCRRRP